MQPAATVAVKLLVLLPVVKHSYHNMALNHFFKFVFLLSCCTSVNTICKCNSVSRFVSTSVRNEWHSGTRCTEHTELHSNSPFQTRCVLNHRGFCCFFYEGGLRSSHGCVRLRPKQSSIHFQWKSYFRYTALFIFPHRGSGQLCAEDIYFLCFMTESVSNIKNNWT